MRSCIEKGDEGKQGREVRGREGGSRPRHGAIDGDGGNIICCRAQNTTCAAQPMCEWERGKGVFCSPHLCNVLLEEGERGR